jgi:hypothetical protein
VLASFGAEHGHGTEGRDGGRRWLLTERKRENCEGSDVGGATQRKEEGRGPGSVAPRRGGRREGGRGWQSARRTAGRGGGRSGVYHVSRGASVDRPGKEGAGLGPIEQC